MVELDRATRAVPAGRERDDARAAVERLTSERDDSRADATRAVEEAAALRADPTPKSPGHSKVSN